MGRPLNKHLFGDNSSNNIKVQFHNGTSSVRGYIVRQRSNLKFLCKDENGTTAVCKLVSKASGDLQAGEMSVTVKYDDDTVRQVVKIAKNLVTVAYSGTNPVTGGSHGSNINGQAGWTFGTSTTDSKWQIEEAGTDTSMSGATDYEGDDVAIPAGMDRNAPLPGSGTWRAGNGVGGAGVPAYSLQGTAYDPGGSVASVTNSTAGLYRRKYVGAPFDGAGDTGSYDFTFFSTPSHGPISEAAYEVDNYIGFGQRDDLSAENGYAFEWKGYIQVPVTGTYNTYITCDDDVAMWIGTAALNPSTSNIHHTQAYVNQGVSGANTNSLTLTAGVWYPVRIWFVEFGGSERFQLFMNNNQNSTIYGYNGTSTALQWAHNSATKGYNP